MLLGVPPAFALPTAGRRRGSVPYGLRLRFGAAAGKAAAALALEKQRHPPGT